MLGQPTPICWMLPSITVLVIHVQQFVAKQHPTNSVTSEVASSVTYMCMYLYTHAVQILGMFAHSATTHTSLTELFYNVHVEHLQCWACTHAIDLQFRTLAHCSGGRWTALPYNMLWHTIWYCYPRNLITGPGHTQYSGRFWNLERGVQPLAHMQCGACSPVHYNHKQQKTGWDLGTKLCTRVYLHPISWELFKLGNSYTMVAGIYRWKPPRTRGHSLG